MRLDIERQGVKGRCAVFASSREEASSVVALHTRERHRKEGLKVLEHSLGDLNPVIGGVKAQMALIGDITRVVIVKDVIAGDCP